MAFTQVVVAPSAHHPDAKSVLDLVGELLGSAPRRVAVRADRVGTVGVAAFDRDPAFCGTVEQVLAHECCLAFPVSIATDGLALHRLDPKRDIARAVLSPNPPAGDESMQAGRS